MSQTPPNPPHWNQQQPPPPGQYPYPPQPPRPGAAPFWDQIVNSVLRVVRSDFNREHATEGEKRKLAASPMPLHDQLVQNYAVWRKSALWIGAIATLALVLISLIGFEETYETTRRKMAQPMAKQAVDQLVQTGQVGERQRSEAEDHITDEIMTKFVGRSNTEIVDGIHALMIIASGVGGILIAIAAFKWADLALSKRLARIGWLIMFVAPFIVAMIPITSMFEWEPITAENAQMREFYTQTREQFKQSFSIAFAAGTFLLIGPKVLSLFPGIIRSSMTLKTLLPEAIAPGWAAVLTAPIFVLFLMFIVAILAQVQGSAMLFFGTAMLIGSPIVYVVKSREVLAPHTAQGASGIIVVIRRIAGALAVLGAVILGAYALDQELVGVWDITKFLLSFLASVLALTVVASDFILAVIWAGYAQGKAFQGTPLQESLETKFRSLAKVGLTAFKSKRVQAAAFAPQAPYPSPPTIETPPTMTPQKKPRDAELLDD